eukprot:930875_1
MAEQKESNLITVKSENAFKTSYSKSPYSVLFFWADWHEPCKQIQSVISELSNDHKQLKFYAIDAQEFETTTSSFNVTAVPTIILCKNQQESKRLEAASVPTTVNTIKQFAKHSQTAQELKQNNNNKNNENENENEYFQQCYMESIEFIKYKYLERIKNEQARQYVVVHVTVATQRSNIEKVFNDVTAGIIRKNLDAMKL